MCSELHGLIHRAQQAAEKFRLHSEQKCTMVRPWRNLTGTLGFRERSNQVCRMFLLPPSFSEKKRRCQPRSSQARVQHAAASWTRHKTKQRANYYTLFFSKKKLYSSNFSKKKVTNSTAPCQWAGPNLCQPRSDLPTLITPDAGH